MTLRTQPSKGMPNRSMEERVGKTLMKRGILDEKPLIQWDAVMECQQERCPIVDLCDYYTPDSRRNNAAVQRCLVQTTFLRSLIKMIYNMHSELDEEQLYKIGTHLVPLYKGLARLYVQELGVDTPVITNDRGTKSMHPVFREIREQLKAITMMWKDIGLDGVKVPRPTPSDGTAPIEVVNPNLEVRDPAEKPIKRGRG